MFTWPNFLAEAKVDRRLGGLNPSKPTASMNSCHPWGYSVHIFTPLPIQGQGPKGEKKTEPQVFGFPNFFGILYICIYSAGGQERRYRSDGDREMPRLSARILWKSKDTRWVEVPSKPTITSLSLFCIIADKSWRQSCMVPPLFSLCLNQASTRAMEINIEQKHNSALKYLGTEQRI